MSKPFTCRDCGQQFSIPPQTLKKFPGWTPRQCNACRIGVSQTAKTTDEVVASITGGPDTGVFTDGACEGNPGPGGWGAVMVREGAVLAERSGHDPATTNNRMELTALIEGYRLLDPAQPIAVYSDSSYCINIINEWAAQWAANGWRRGRKREAVLNLDLVQELYELAQSRPLATATWIRGHAGARWNEYADALARSYQHATREDASA
jgi:ribonuclease HI